jgi:2-polyprenyl-6-methoxyphenol hydroxylase-like FAD-dependent oxidoreductase
MEERVDALVGADGLWSTVRRTLHGDSTPRYAGYTAWRGVIAYAGDVRASETWGRGRRFGLVPLADGRVYWFATANAPEHSQMPEGDKSELLGRFGRWHDPIPSVIEQTPDSAILRNDIYDLKPLKTWGIGRVTLLGDAAHAMTPNLGQGACQAIEDGVVLADCLAREPDTVEALRSYERARAPHTAMVIERSRRLGRVGQLQNPVATWLRDTLVGALPARSQLSQLAPIVGYDLGAEH